MYNKNQLAVILSTSDPHTVLHVSGPSTSDRRAVLCERIKYTRDKMIQNDENFLILTTSKKSVSDIKKILDKEFERSTAMKVATFSDLVDEILTHKFPSWKILKEPEIRKVLEKLGQSNIVMTYGKCKKAIKQLGSISELQLKTLGDEEAMMRYGLSKDDSLLIKKHIGGFTYFDYSDIMSNFTKESKFKIFENIKFIGALNFQNMTVDEVSFLSKISGDKHLTFLTYEDPSFKHVQYEKNLKFIYGNESAVNKIHLGINMDKPKISSATKDTNLKHQLKKNKLNPKELNNILTVVKSVLKDPNLDFPLMQLISLIPEIDEIFIDKLCDAATIEKTPIFELLIKYQESLNESVKSRLSPIIKYISNAISSSENFNPDSINVHCLNICKILGIQDSISKDINFQFFGMYTSFNEMPQRVKCQPLGKLSEYVIMNEGLSKSSKEKKSVGSKMKNNQFIDIEDLNMKVAKMTLDVKLGLPINVQKGDLNVAVSNVTNPLRRSSSVRGKSRPRSWNASVFLNAARKLK